jgi:nicotinate dehydrogenase subunit A
MGAITLKVNDSTPSLDLDPSTWLLYGLSDDVNLRGPKFGLGPCCSCTVILKGQAARSCIVPVEAVAEDEITTLDGLGTFAYPRPIQQAFGDERAARCSFCLNPVVMTAKAFVDKKLEASDEQMERAVSRVLSSCFTHTGKLRVIRRYAQRIAR